MKAFKDKTHPAVLPEMPSHSAKEINVLLRDLQFANEKSKRKLEKICSFLDSCGSFVESFSVCSKGCAHCCYIDVGVIDLESAFITEKTGRKSRRFTGLSSVENTYFIYNCRPFQCRTFHTLDDLSYCNSREDHQVYGGLDGQYTVTFYSNLNDVIQFFAQQKPPHDVRDCYG